PPCLLSSTAPAPSALSPLPLHDALPISYIGRARVVPLRNTGAALSPFNAFLILQGLETLPLRMERISENTLKIARHLEAHPEVRSEEHTSELQSRENLVCRLLLEKKKIE